MSERTTWIRRMRRRWSIKKHKQQPSTTDPDQKPPRPSLDRLTTHDAVSVEALPAYTASVHSDPDQIYSLPESTSTADVRVFRVGKDIPETRKRHYTASTTGVCSRGYSYYYQNDPLLYTFDEKRDIPDDAVPYLDDCDYENLAARIARQQSLLQRNLHRMSMLLSRRPAGLL
ncbi:hypothetical protein LPJ56_000473 [Coemansia sp. RSA 2599]|nr:hypothetical protein LPJ56_000473 [Coemansia sp. RSA 2599]